MDMPEEICVITPISYISINFYTRLTKLSGRRGAGAYPSGHWARGGVHPGQVYIIYSMKQRLVITYILVLNCYLQAL